MSKSREAGRTLVELVVAVGIIMVGSSIAIPSLRAYSEEAHLLGAAREFELEFRKARSIAIRSSAYTAIRFEECAGGPCYSVYVDQDRDGIRSDDIAAGRDVRIEGPFALTGRAPGVRVGINSGVPEIPPERGLLDPDGDPIRFGLSRMISFSPIGGATPGTFYLAGEGGMQAAVRVNGSSSRVRLMVWHGVWRER
jgi:hypothetical protein